MTCIKRRDFRQIAKDAAFRIERFGDEIGDDDLRDASHPAVLLSRRPTECVLQERAKLWHFARFAVMPEGDADDSRLRM